MRPRSDRARNRHRTFPSGLTDLDLEGHRLADARSRPILREGGNVDEYLGPTLDRGDEPKAAIIIPFGQRPVDSHLKCLPDV